eukprot:TRINITY_DN252_c0_g1_i1.p1 TRINITY_DN252_c0_g1~~TRINITY_DN252_c0_g1_i1.p1  ORF type:complete len:345 (-),score=88.56 TRINITY_DN252_c0_g1_i1:872-1906(-)
MEVLEEVDGVRVLKREPTSSRAGVELHFFESPETHWTCVSPEWEFHPIIEESGGHIGESEASPLHIRHPAIQFVRLSPGGSLVLRRPSMVKILLGKLFSSTREDPTPRRIHRAIHKWEIQKTVFSEGTKIVVESISYFCLVSWHGGSEIPHPSDDGVIVDAERELYPHRVTKGRKTPESDDVMRWRLVSSLVWGKEAFAHMPFWNFGGWLLRNEKGEEVSYVQMWAVGWDDVHGGNCGNHDHSNDPTEDGPAFAEQHLTLFNAGESGMVEIFGDEEKTIVHRPLPVGFEHGLYCSLDEDGRVIHKSNGAAVYPMHRWQWKGSKDSDRLDVWMAFEIPTGLVRFK